MSFTIGTEWTFLTVCRHGFYFRIWGYGLNFCSHKNMPPLFSERYGYTKAWHPFGQICIRLLKPRELL